MPKLRISPIILLMALICFVFPFVHVSCKMDNPLQNMQQLGKDKPDPAKDAKKEKDNVIMTYNGYHLVFGLAPTNRMMKDKPGEEKPAEKPAPASVTETQPGMNDVMQTVAQEPEAMPAPVNDSVKADDSKAAKPDDAKKGEKEEQKATPNPYALFAFILILAGIPLSFVKHHLGALVVAIISLVAAILLYLMKVFFPAYLLKYMQLDPQAMQYLGLEFTPAFWAAFILPLLAMIESVMHFVAPHREPQYAYSTGGELNLDPEHLPADLADVIEPSDVLDDIHEAEELERVADLENIKDPEDIPVPIPEKEEEEKPE